MGVTVCGGLPVPIATPAHGTAFEIAGKGVARPGAIKEAFRLITRLAAGNLKASPR
jgi:4-hydroxythreonine-4-phosphate dehydrogenase